MNMIVERIILALLLCYKHIKAITSGVSKALFPFIKEKSQTKLKKSLFPLFDGLISITHVQLVTKQSPITK